MPLVVIDRTSAKGGQVIIRISTGQWRKSLTLAKWEKQNPKVWEQIKTFVYKRDLNKKPSKRSNKRYPADLKPKKKKKRRWWRRK